MRILFTLLFVLFAGGSANAALIQIDYTGTYSGTITTGNPAISEFTTVEIGPTPFSLTFVFETLTPFAWYSDSPTSSRLSSGYGPSAGYVYGSFFFSISGFIFADDTATTGSTSQTVVDQTFSKGGISNRPLSISVSHPDIPGSITQPYSISSGLTGTGYYFYDYAGVFASVSESYVLSPETITVTISGVPEPSTWAMLLIGFAGIGFLGYRSSSGCTPDIRHEPYLSPDTVSF